MSLYGFGPFQLDAERLLLLDGGQPVALGPKVVETLLALVERPSEVLAKNVLLERIWPEGYVDEANLAQNVYVLRKTLRARWPVEAIETIPRRGYRFVADVRLCDRAERVRLPAPVPEVQPRRRSTGAWLVAAAAALAFAGSLAWLTAAPRSNGATALSAEGSRLYEIGRYYWNLRTREGIAKSVDYFKRVVNADPRDALGYAGLASANAIEADYGYGPAPPSVYVARARAYARQALSLDPACGQAYAVLGMLASEKRDGKPADMTHALRDLRKAIALDPASGSAHEWYGIALLHEGRVDAAYAELATAAQLDPLSVATTAWLSTASYLERRYGDAIAYARETLDLSPDRGEVYETLGLAYEALGDRSRAEQALDRFSHACPQCRAEAAALLAPIYARGNQMGRARAELTIARAHAADVAPEDLAVAYAAVGDRGAALVWLRRSQTGFAAAEMANDPRFAGLRRAAAVAPVQKPA